jgi:LacI family transcriptional regulator
MIILALGAIKGLHHVQRRVPGDVSVIGFDNISYATAITPEPPRSLNRITEMRETILQLLTQIHDPASAVGVMVLEPTLIERESCRAVMSS